ncbi:hypothetical protein [Sodalinema gerasimenkoae]|uniref:hypothetical protein n=1 Tax=Sodalinema gerasimenkoae TaxID=2862348 RepID=UPI001FECF001|nr:hypothetical protein [Sodalinema gerasimenkoae]
MDSRTPKLDRYRQIVGDLLQRHSLDKPSYSDIEVYYFLTLFMTIIRSSTPVGIGLTGCLGL